MEFVLKLIVLETLIAQKIKFVKLENVQITNGLIWECGVILMKDAQMI